MYAIDQTSLQERLCKEDLRVEVFPAEEVPETYVQQLIEKSRQPHVMEFEGHEDAEGRFKDLASYREWCSGKKRVMYLLLKDDDVAGVIWFGRRENSLAPGYGVTFAVRLYAGDAAKGWGDYLGKGLAVPFMRAAHADAAKHFPGEWVWLDYVAGNDAAERTYTKFGYEKLTEKDGHDLHRPDGRVNQSHHYFVHFLL